MTVSAADKQMVISGAIQEISHIATLPEVTLKIIELVENPSSTAQDLHNVISYDPALCSRLLKVVNSAFYGLPGQIGSINRAIVLLGLNAVKNIAIAASLAKLFRGGQLCPSFSARDLWKHSTAAAAAGKLLADKLKLGLPDEAFLAGLIHDIGVMVEMQADRHKLIEVFDQLAIDPQGVPARPMIEQEIKTFGASHTEFGSALCDKWKFPKTFALVCGGHHAPLETPAGARTMPCVVYIADRLAAQLGAGFRLDLQSTEISPDVLEELKLTQKQVDDVAAILPQQLEEVEQLLS